MMEEMPSSEFVRWQIIERLEPFGVYGDWLRHGFLMAAVVGALRKEGTPAPKAEDFIPETLQSGYVYREDRKGNQEDPGKQKPETIFALMMMVKAHQDSIVKRQQEEEQERENARNRRLEGI